MCLGSGKQHLFLMGYCALAHTGRWVGLGQALVLLMEGLTWGGHHYSIYVSSFGAHHAPLWQA